MLRRDHGIPVIAGHTGFGEPLCRAGLKTKGHDNGVGFYYYLASRDRLGAATTVWTRLTQLCFNHLYTDGFTKVIHHLNRLAIKEKLHALLFRVGDFSPRAGHVLLVATIHTVNAIRLLSHGGPHAVHGGITTTQHHNRLFFQVDEFFRVARVIHLLIDIGYQVIQRLVDAGLVFAGEAPLYGLICAHAEEYRVVISKEFFNRNVAANLGIQPELDAHTLEYFPATLHHLLLELELRDAKR